MKNVKKLVFATLFCALAILTLAACGNSGSESTAPTVGTVSVEIVFPESYQQEDMNFTYDFHEGETLLDIMSALGQENKFAVVHKHSGDMAYITGIAGYEQGEDGAESGWVYTINGEYPTKRPGGTTVSDGDVIHWQYALSMGDLN